MNHADTRNLDKKRINGVSDGVRTRGHQDHNLVLYQLSYTHLKITPAFYQKPFLLATLFLILFDNFPDYNL